MSTRRLPSRNICDQVEWCHCAIKNSVGIDFTPHTDWELSQQFPVHFSSFIITDTVKIIISASVINIVISFSLPKECTCSFTSVMQLSWNFQLVQLSQTTKGDSSTIYTENFCLLCWQQDSRIVWHGDELSVEHGQVCHSYALLCLTDTDNLLNTSNSLPYVYIGIVATFLNCIYTAFVKPINSTSLDNTICNTRDTCPLLYCYIQRCLKRPIEHGCMSCNVIYDVWRCPLKYVTGSIKQSCKLVCCMLFSQLQNVSQVLLLCTHMYSSMRAHAWQISKLMWNLNQFSEIYHKLVDVFYRCNIALTSTSSCYNLR